MMRRLATILLLVCAALVATPARAERDARVDALLDRLKAARDAGEAEALEGQIWRRWIEAGSSAAVSLVVIGAGAMQSGDLPAALGLFDAVTVQNPDYAEGWNKRATALFLMGALEKSAEDVARVLALEPRHFGALSGLGLIRARQERWDDAIAAFDAALAVHPFLENARKNLEALKRQRGDRGI